MAKGLKSFVASFIIVALVGGGFCAPVFAQDIKPQPKETQLQQDASITVGNDGDNAMLDETENNTGDNAGSQDGGVISAEPKAKVHPAPPAQNLMSVPQAVEDVTIKDWLNEDTTSVTGLKCTSITSGTAPWDNNNERGNDTDANNDVIRSFDKATYDYELSLTPDDKMTYYKNARVGIRVELPYPKDKVTFDVSSMSWADQTHGFEPSVTDENGTQVFTAYRLLSSVQNGTVAPGTYALSIILKTMAAQNGYEFAPMVKSWVAYDFDNPTNEGTHTAASNRANTLHVSAKLNLNIRLTNTWNGTERGFDFDQPGAQNQPNYGIGTVVGMLSAYHYAVQLRWEDRSKGMRGLEMPTGPIGFTMEISNRWQNAGSSSLHPAESDLQPYLWSATEIQERQYAPGRNGIQYGYPASTVGLQMARSGHYGNPNNVYNPQSSHHHAHTWENGNLVAVESRQSNKTVIQVTVKDYQINPEYFPSLAWGSTSDPNRFYDSYYASTTGELQIGEIATGRIQLVSPSTMSNGQSVTDKYHSEVSLQQSISAIKAVTGVSVSGYTVNNQVYMGDDSLAVTALRLRPGSFSQDLWYACYANLSVGQIIHNGSDCGTWQSPVSNGGTDVKMRGDYVALGIDTIHSNFLSVLDMTFMTIDPNYLEFDDEPQVFGPAIWADSTPFSYHTDDVPSVFWYATKKDGTGWTNYVQQRSTNLESGILDFWPSVSQAKRHGPIVGVLFTQPDAAQSKLQDITYRMIYNRPVAHIRQDAPIGGVAAITAESYAYSRNALAGKYGAPASATAPDDQWRAWAQKQDALAMYRAFKPDWKTKFAGRYNKAVYNDGGYQGGDSGGRQLGDSLYIAGEYPKVGITVSQQDTNGASKRVFDMDKEERIVDWNIPVHVESVTPAPEGYRTEGYVTIKLPNKVTYMPGTAYLNGTYTPNGAEHIAPSDGEPVDMSVSADGKTLKFTVPNMVIDKDYTLRFSTVLGDAFNPANDVVNNEQFTLTTTVKSKYNKANPLPVMGTQTSCTISVIRTKASQLATRANPLVTDINTPITFYNKVTNSADTAKANAFGVVIVPANGSDSTHFVGKITVSGINTNAESVYVSTDAKYSSMTATDIHYDEVRNWTKLEIKNGKVQGVPANITAFAFAKSALAAGGSISADYCISPTGNVPADLYVNQLADGNNVVKAISTIVDREVNGVVWEDGNKNGMRDADERLIEGAHVVLLHNGLPLTTLFGVPGETKTDTSGAYSIRGIPAGSGFSIKITAPDGVSWNNAKATTKHAAMAGADVNSDADEVKAGSAADGLSIGLAQFPQVAQMTGARYVDAHEDAGIVIMHNQLATMPQAGATPWLLLLGIVSVLGTLFSVMLLLGATKDKKKK